MALDLNDKTVNGNNLTNTGSVAEWVTDFPFVACTEAVEFTDTNGKSLDANDNASLDLTTAVTIEFWAKRDAGAGVAAYWISKTGTDGTNYAVYEYDSAGATGGKWRFFYTSGDGAVTHSWQTDSAYTDTGWHHWAFVCTFGTEASMKTYYDGSEVANTLIGGTGTAAVDSCDGKLIIGNYQSASTLSVDGKMTEVRIWSDIRSEAEIQANMSKHLVGNEANLMAYYPLQSILVATTNYLNDYRASQGGRLSFQ